jgi:TonB family protein
MACLITISCFLIFTANLIDVPDPIFTKPAPPANSELASLFDSATKHLEKNRLEDAVATLVQIIKDWSGAEYAEHHQFACFSLFRILYYFEVVEDNRDLFANCPQIWVAEMYGDKDRDLIPLSRPSIKPLPAAAVRDGVPPGQVIVVFDVSAEGRVVNAKILVSRRPYYRKYIMDAVQEFQYLPKIVGGQPVSVQGLQFRYTFKNE